MIDFPSAVLFACTMNSVRSAIAEGLLKNLLGKAVYVDSAGVRPGSIDGFAVEVMNEIGIDISRHKAKTFDHLEDRSFDVIISLSIEAQHKATEISRVWPVMLSFGKLLIRRLSKEIVKLGLGLTVRFEINCL